ncbi:starch synthase [Trifolium repens]|nr:starch synthase [Trifolium repens]
MPRAPATTPRPRQPRVLHAHQLPLGSSPNHIVLGEVCSDTICNAPNCFQDDRLTRQTNTSLFSELCPHLHAFRETSQKVTHPKTTPSQARLTVEFLWNELPKRRCILLV